MTPKDTKSQSLKCHKIFQLIQNVYDYNLSREGEASPVLGIVRESRAIWLVLSKILITLKVHLSTNQTLRERNEAKVNSFVPLIRNS